jgi:hypothetical protein
MIRAAPARRCAGSFRSAWRLQRKVDHPSLLANVQAWLRQRIGREADGREAMVPDTIGVEPDTSVIKLGLFYIGRIGPDEGIDSSRPVTEARMSASEMRGRLTLIATF